ncbi:hypothetical protein Cgig2_005797 [Carnegiea gigantea]|uniref:Uncharacterized protein n=1 Tax=Carnegiea gigantea TaxID=171969 RepID=A0A9Q1KGX9_9CARY|nr:hypothetical protein Cgig2_005797 [Carnegiea gigantea]
MFPRSLIRETGPLTQEHCVLSSMQEPVGGVIVRNFDTYEVDGEASSSPGMVKSSGLGQAKSFQLEEARELIGFGRGFRWWHSSIIDRLKETLMDDNKLSRAEFAYVVSIRSNFVSYYRQFGFHQDVPADMDFDNLPDPETMLCCHHVLTRYGTGSQDKLPIGVCELSTEKVIKLPPEDAENIMDILHAEPNLTKCMEESGDVNFKEEVAHVPLPSGNQCFSSIERIPSFGKDLFDSASRLDGSKGVCSASDDEVESIRRANAPLLEPRPQHPLRAPQLGISVFNAITVIKVVDKNAPRVVGKAILEKVCHTSFDGLPSLKGDFDRPYATIFQRGVNVTLSECKVQGKLDDASHRLNTEGAHYEAKAAELKQVESRHEGLLKELQLLEDQKKDPSS